MVNVNGTCHVSAFSVFYRVIMTEGYFSIHPKFFQSGDLVEALVFLLVFQSRIIKSNLWLCYAVYALSALVCKRYTSIFTHSSYCSSNCEFRTISCNYRETTKDDIGGKRCRGYLSDEEGRLVKRLREVAILQTNVAS